MWLAYGSTVILDVADLFGMSGNSVNESIPPENARIVKTKRR